MNQALREAFIKASQTNEEVYATVCKVITVDESKRTCDVEPIDGSATIYDVRLQANESDTEGVVVFPKKDSMVIVSFLGKEVAYVALCSEIEAISIVKKSAFHAKDDVAELFDVISDLIELLKTFKLSTNVGVTINVLPDIVMKLERLKKRNNEVKKHFSELLK